MTASAELPDAAWGRAIAEHDEEVERFIALLASIPAESWHRPPAPGKWSPAAVAVHVARAYEFGRDAAGGGAGMRMLVAPWQAWLGRTVILPLVLATKRFPRGARAPREVVPDLALSERTSVDDAITMLRTSARECVATVRAPGGADAVPKVTHAYFGALPPRTALRLLSAHTRHHAQALARDAVGAPRG